MFLAFIIYSVSYLGKKRFGKEGKRNSGRKKKQPSPSSAKAQSPLTALPLTDLAEEEEMPLIEEDEEEEPIQPLTSLKEKSESPPKPTKSKDKDKDKKSGKKGKDKDKDKGKSQDKEKEKQRRTKKKGQDKIDEESTKPIKPPPVEFDRIDTSNKSTASLNDSVSGSSVNNVTSPLTVKDSRGKPIDLELNANQSAISGKSSILSPTYSPFMTDDGSGNRPSMIIKTSMDKKSSKYRPFGGDASPKKAAMTPRERIKRISMEFSKGDLKAKLKKITTTKKKKRNGTIRNVYEKYAAKADYPKLDDLRNETLVSEFLSFELYDQYRGEISIIQDYTIDSAISCACFYMPDPIGFRLGSFHTYEIFQDLCDELLSILHDEWNPKDRPHSKCQDWRLLINNGKKAIGYESTSDKMKRSKSPNPDGSGHSKRRRSRNHSSASKPERKGSQGMFQLSQQIKEKRKKSKRRKNTNTDLMIKEDAEISDTSIASTSVDLSHLEDDYAEITKPIQRSESVNEIRVRPSQSDAENDGDEQKEDKSYLSAKRHSTSKREKRRKSHKRGKSKERNISGLMRHSTNSVRLGHGGHGSMHHRTSFNQNSSFMMARLQLWDNDYVSGCRITLSRNIEGFRFNNVISRSERRNIENVLSTCLSQCNEGPLKGRYRPYSKINKKKLPLLIETDKLFPKPDAPALIMAGYARDWPESRGIFINNNKNLYIWW